MRCLLGLLEEKLTRHDENRKEVQKKLEETCSEIRKGADSLEERISGEIREDSNAKETRIYGLIEKLNEGGGNLDALVKDAEEELSREFKYEIQQSSPENSFADSFELKISSVKVEKEFDFGGKDKN